MHCHTIFSYNGYGHSPASLAWLARQAGWHAWPPSISTCWTGWKRPCGPAIVPGCGLLRPGNAGLCAEYASREINSPGEPGVLYFVGLGFTWRSCRPGAAVLADMRRRAAERNRDVVARVNAYLAPWPSTMTATCCL
jgi:hypothetical protein